LEFASICFQSSSDFVLPSAYRASQNLSFTILRLMDALSRQSRFKSSIYLVIRVLFHCNHQYERLVNWTSIL
jgi:hypothetical protein